MKTCSLCQSSFTVPEDSSAFVEKMDFSFGAQKIRLPEPISCPDCANKIRTAHRNERNLYQRKSDLTGKQMISLYPQKAPSGEPYKVYSYDEWYSDEWDAMDYGRDFDFSRGFFEQFAELQKAVPRAGLIVLDNENSPYTTGTAYSKNCHLINSSEHCEDCYYGKLLQSCKNCVDATYNYDSERCYECFSIYNCYNCVQVSFSSNSSDCWFSENLKGCKNCFLCTNLSNKEYYFMNEPLEAEEYHRRVDEFVGSHRNLTKAREILDRLRAERIHKYANIVSSENCSGDFIQNSQNCHNVYDVNDSQDCRNLWVGVKIKDAYECSNLYFQPQLTYQVLASMESYHVAFSSYVFTSSDILYCDFIHGSNNLFGCVGVKNKSHCIFNKQYDPESYDKLVLRILEHMKQTGEWGQFFPPEYAPHAYNESLAQEYYPLDKAAVEQQGWNWRDELDREQYQGPGFEIPDHIDDIDDSITEEVLLCEATGKPYKINKQELAFYRDLKIPIPRLCPDARHFRRLRLRNERRLWERQCAQCAVSMLSTFAPDRPETVSCERCYQQAVY